MVFLRVSADHLKQLQGLNESDSQLFEKLNLVNSVQKEEQAEEK